MIFILFLASIKDLLPPDYAYRLSLPVSPLHILLSDVVPVTDVNIAHEQLDLFYDLVPELYGEEICTANMHTLIHLSQCEHNWGPLWSYSCFWM